jgi:hypothetical protein
VSPESKMRLSFARLVSSEEYNPARSDLRPRFWRELLPLLEPFFGEARYRAIHTSINNYWPYDYGEIMVACDWLNDQGKEEESEAIRNYLTRYSEKVKPDVW